MALLLPENNGSITVNACDTSTTHEYFGRTQHSFAFEHLTPKAIIRRKMATKPYSRTQLGNFVFDWL